MCRILAALVAAIVMCVPAAQASAQSGEDSILSPTTWLRDGTSVALTVQTAPNIRYELVAHQVLTDDDGNFLGMLQVGGTGDLFSGPQGRIRAVLDLPARGEGESGGLVIISTPDLQTPDFEEFGIALPYGTGTPILLGDGYDTSKPVGTPLELRLTGTIPGTRFRVELSDSHGRWQDTTSGVAAAGAPDGISTVPYVIPQGLRAEPHQFRLVNESTGLVVAQWEATPDPTGDPQPYAEPLTAEALGVQMGNQPQTHPTATVRTVSAVISGSAVAIVLFGTWWTNRRIRIGATDA